ncbi:MAG: hypothetical protein M3346_04060 [Actinomycetota bacterium]|nr:hypothetical protein [Actinomycetota bacterium]
MRWWRPGGVWPWLFIAHTVIVVALTSLFLVLLLSTSPEDGANIGAGIIALPLLLLGLPWSLPAIIDPYRFDGLTTFTWYAVTLGPAALNVALYGVVMIVVRTRGRRATMTADSTQRQ